MNASLKAEFLNSINTCGLPRACCEYVSKLGFEGEAEALATFNLDGRFDLLAYVLNSCSEDWTEGRNAHIVLDVFRHGIRTGFGLTIERLLEVAYIIWSHVGGDKDYNLTINAVVHYIDTHQCAAEDAGEVVFSNDRYLCFMADLFPVLYRIDHKKWGRRFVAWYDSASDVFRRRAGLAALSNLETASKTISADDVLGRTAQAFHLYGVNDVGLACYFVCRKWKVHPTHGMKFEFLLREMLGQMGGAALQNIAFLEHSYVTDASLEEIQFRLKEFSRVDFLENNQGGVDLYLAEVVKVNDELAQEFIEQRIVSCAELARRKDVFKETFCCLYEKSEVVRSRIITRWLLATDRVFRQAVERFVGVERQEAALTAYVDVDQVPGDRVARVNLFRHAIGWLFASYECCVSFAVSCLDLLDSEMLRLVASDCYGMLVVNFPDLVEREHKDKDRRHTPAVKRFLGHQLKTFAEMRQLVEKNPCPELSPSLDDRLAYGRIRQRQYAEIMNQARENSILKYFGPAVNVLYGHGAVSNRIVSGGKSERVEIPFHKTTTSMRIPGMLNFHGPTLEAKLVELRAGRVLSV